MIIAKIKCGISNVSCRLRAVAAPAYSRPCWAVDGGSRRQEPGLLLTFAHSIPAIPFLSDVCEHHPHHNPGLKGGQPLQVSPHCSVLAAGWLTTGTQQSLLPSHPHAILPALSGEPVPISQPCPGVEGCVGNGSLGEWGWPRHPAVSRCLSAAERTTPLAP